jgi:hypothetical protein
VTSIRSPGSGPGGRSAGSRALFDISSRLLPNRSLMFGRSNLLSYSPAHRISASPPFHLGGTMANARPQPTTRTHPCPRHDCRSARRQMLFIEKLAGRGSVGWLLRARVPARACRCQLCQLPAGAAECSGGILKKSRRSTQRWREPADRRPSGRVDRRHEFTS